MEAVAGNVLGNSGADYTLYLTHVAESGGPALTDFTIPQSFTDPPWVAGGIADNFVAEQNSRVPAPREARGHTYHYEGRLVGTNNDVVSFEDSNSFILV